MMVMARVMTGVKQALVMMVVVLAMYGKAWEYWMAVM